MVANLNSLALVEFVRTIITSNQLRAAINQSTKNVKTWAPGARVVAKLMNAVARDPEDSASVLREFALMLDDLADSLKFSPKVDPEQEPES